MNIIQKLSSKNLFIFNLVLIGAIFGFSLAFLSFSCSTPKVQAKAQEAPVKIPEDALAMAEGLQTVFRSVSEKVLPSVVELKTVSVRRQQTIPGIPWDFFFGPRERDRDRGNGQDRERRSEGLGSGIIVRNKDGVYYVLTNHHVVEGTSEIKVSTRNGKEYSGTLVGSDERKDLAMVSFKTNDAYPLATLGDSDKVAVGDWAIAMGNPLGEQFSFSVTLGIVSALGRTGGPGGNINDFIQTDAPINQGNSGGPLVNIRGEIIGINTWIASNTMGGGNVGLGFAIPINNTKRSIDEFISTGSISYGWLGVLLTEPGKETAESLGLEGKRGALAAQVFIDSPADKGGIKPGDFITHVNGKEIRGVQQLTLTVGELKPGDRAAFTVIRDKKSVDFQVRIEARTDKVVSESNSNKLWPGVNVVPLNDQLKETLELPKDAKGLYVVDVTDGSPAKIVGLQRGDRIISVNGEKTENMAAFFKALREKTGSELWFGMQRGDATVESLRYKR